MKRSDYDYFIALAAANCSDTNFEAMLDETRKMSQTKCEFNQFKESLAALKKAHKIQQLSDERIQRIKDFADEFKGVQNGETR